MTILWEFDEKHPRQVSAYGTTSWVFSAVPGGTVPPFKILPSTDPDFLYADLDRSACAAFFMESRMGLIDSTKLNRKSGSVLGYFQPSLRD
jgi:hypothetical protein